MIITGAKFASRTEGLESRVQGEKPAVGGNWESLSFRKEGKRRYCGHALADVQTWERKMRRLYPDYFYCLYFLKSKTSRLD